MLKLQVGTACISDECHRNGCEHVPTRLVVVFGDGVPPTFRFLCELHIEEGESDTRAQVAAGDYIVVAAYRPELN